MSTSSPDVYLATNNGDIGGGEVMLFALAEALQSLGLVVSVVAPTAPSGVLETARGRGLEAVALPAENRLAYMRALREWRRKNKDGLLWCNGLVPAFATAGSRHRIAHLHQLPTPLQVPAVTAARIGARATVVPSEFVARRVRKATVLHNWTASVDRIAPRRTDGRVRLGFLGRPSEAKGIHVLADAVDLLRREEPEKYRLRIAGEPRFVDARERAFIESRMRSMGRSAERLGWMPADEFFSSIDVLVVPSVVPESFGLVAAEAMSARVPVVVSDAGAMPEVVGPGHPWIARAGDSADLARVIREASGALPAGDVVDHRYLRWQEHFSPESGKARLRGVLEDLGILQEVRG
ncbi:hypothetical protein SCMU_28990 [Sinomonas cyclohexanicum]|uniref:Glycosyltransferase subfamily 4-like N-terminal domain-containing protein n=1 Tax=Sinomonas cyclohexanicum TaxID=322009 RepID=A0ABN6FJI6_SINCY|nr:glycosyltransferase [Corynebacterium cyclohexanicum]BCT77057.1 hypothetical protein SCMU_28990 [Corynebacterium cyclohexanicum]